MGTQAFLPVHRAAPRRQGARALPQAQRGVALIVGMVILVVLALLGVSAYSVATQDERLAGNARDHARAVDAAESVLRECEYYIQNYQKSTGNALVFSNSNGMELAPTSGAGWQGDLDPGSWHSAYALPAGKMSTMNWSKTPQCIAEEFDLPNSDTGVHRATQAAGSQPPMKVARITAVGYGVNPSTKVTLISYFSFF